MSQNTPIPVLEWTGLYDANHREVITPISYSHPAKFARGLAERIVDFGLEQGFWRKGNTILDPFAGVSIGGIICTSRGLRWVGIELESRFQRMSAGHDCPGSKGKEADLCPECLVESQKGWEKGGQPKHRFRGNFDLHRHKWEAFGDPLPVCVQGDSRRLREVLKEAGLLDGCLTSPPYAEGLGHGGRPGQAPHDSKGTLAAMETGYGRSAGQLGAMKDTGLDAAITSPPYSQDGLGHGGGTSHIPHDSNGTMQAMRSGYGTADGNLGNTTADTFWEAAGQIVREMHGCLREGAVAAFVVKSFVRKKRLVDFPGDWRRLLEANGFEVFLEVHANLVKEERHPGLFGEEQVRRRSKKSFFRRLCEAKGAPSIDFEVVLWARKVGGAPQDGLMGGAVTSPPFSEPGSQPPNVGGARPVRSRQREQPDRPGNYGTAPGQLGAMRPGEPP